MPDTLFNRSSIPVISPGYRFQWEEAQGCYVLLYPEGMVTLNSAAGEILKRVAEREQTVEEIVLSLKAAFNGADLEADVYEFLEEAHGNGWIKSK
ncbi:MAG: pyrroloquinoline quinone biosynthesis peptide chaperone PqqD [Gammaproteobacteria bacterium]|nr:MAG: pyrroloquinoline quinone biosynthesis peptide chaperone PqqD [Gammaproteobacteria bacterium]